MRARSGAACPSPRLSAWTTLLRRNIAAMTSRIGDTVSDLTGLEIKPKTSRADRKVLSYCVNGWLEI